MKRCLIAALYCLSLSAAGLLTEDAKAQDSSTATDSSASAPAPDEEGSSSHRSGAIRDTGEHTRPLALSAMAYLPWYYGFGIGVNARLEIPIVPDGFISAINDQVSLEPSLGLGYRSYGLGAYSDNLTFFDITPALYGMWSFHITPKFRPYGAIGLGYDIAIWLNEDDLVGAGNARTSYFYWDLAAGLFYNFSEHLAFRGELGSQGPKAGLSLLF